MFVGSDRYSEASEYLHKIATDKFLLKILGNESYRMFAISPDNFSILKRLNNIDQYVVSLPRIILMIVTKVRKL